MLYSAGQIAALARAAGIPAGQVPTAVAVALAESGGDTSAVGDVGLEDATWGPSVGLWQIRSRRAEYGKGTSRDESRLKDPSFNAHAMAAISGGGTNWRPWSTFTSGAYRAHLPAAQAAAGGASAQPVSLTTDLLGGASGLLGGVGNPLQGVQAVGAFFAALANPATWLRVLQVLLGALCLAAGANILTKGAVGQYVHTAATTAGTAALAA